jgi:hypothetical protein
LRFVLAERDSSYALALVIYSFLSSNPCIALSRSVTLPDGVSEGQTIHVQAPDGQLNAIVIPPGFGPGYVDSPIEQIVLAKKKPSIQRNYSPE